MYDRACGRLEGLRAAAGFVIEEDRKDEFDDDQDEPQQPRTLTELVNDEAAA